MRRGRSLLPLVLWLVAASSAFALGSGDRGDRPGEPGNYSVSTWRLKDGLPSSVIWSIAQDSDGYLWVGTAAGLVRCVSWDLNRLTPQNVTPITNVGKSRPWRCRRPEGCGWRTAVS